MPLSVPSAGSSVGVVDEMCYLTDPRWGGGSLARDGTVDWKAVVDTAVAAVQAAGGEIVVPPHAYGLSAPPAIPGTVKLRGVVNSFAGFGTPVNPSKGSIFVALAGFTPGTQLDTSETNGMMRFGSGAFPPNTTAGTETEDKTGGGAENIIFDCRGLANGPQTAGRRQILEKCWVVAPLKHGYMLNGQNGRLDRCYASCKSVAASDGVWVNNWDNKISELQCRDHGSGGAVNARGNCAGLEFKGGHVYSTVGPGFHAVIDQANVTPMLIAGVTFDECGDNNQVEMFLSGAGTIQGFQINGCVFYKNAPFTTDGSKSVVYLDPITTASGIRGNITGCNVSTPGSGATNFKAFVEKSGNTGSASIGLDGNYGFGLLGVVSGLSMPRGANLMVSKAFAAFRSDSSGTSTFNGTGAQTVFTIAHGLGSTPTAITVTPNSAAAAGGFYATADATNITVTYTTAPASGTNNVVLGWMVRA